MVTFQEACIHAAEDIRAGSLDSTPEYPDEIPVHKSSWEPLARINEMGLLTFVSQDALYGKTGTSNSTERAYLVGYMPLQAARKFVTNFNVNSSNMIASLQVAVPENFWYEKRKYHESMGITNYDDLSGRNVPKLRGADLGLTTKEEEVMVKQFNNISESVHLYCVLVVDPKWGRPATSKRGLWKAVIKVLETESE